MYVIGPRDMKAHGMLLIASDYCYRCLRSKLLSSEFRI